MALIQDERVNLLRPTLDAAYKKTPEKEREIIMRMRNNLRKIRNMWDATALEVIAAVGRFLDEPR